MTTPRPAPTPLPNPRPEEPATEPPSWFVRAFTPFWVVPALWCLAALALGVLVPEVDQSGSGWVPFLFEGGPASARTVLSTIAGAMISVTGLVFSITIVVLQLASSQFSPRVLATFLDDRLTQHTLGVFAATFVYALTVLRSVFDVDRTAVPQLGVTLAYLLVLAAVGMFLAFIHHITQSISVSTVIGRVAQDTRDLLRRSHDVGDELPVDPPDLPSLARSSTVTAQRSGYLDTVDHVRLRRAATSYDARVELLYPLGTFVPEGAPVALVRHDGELDPGAPDAVRRGLGIARERTMTQDITFGLRRLVDIAERALSPGTNDPTTAVQAIDELHDILRRLAGNREPYPVEHDDDGVPRLVTREWTFDQYLDLAVDEIAHWGASGIQVPRRLDEMFVDLAVAVPERHREAVRDKGEKVRRVCART